MLFGRRKPGFVQIENLEGQAENDANNTEEKPDLMAFLSSLPEVEDEFADLEESEEPEEEVELTEGQKFAEYIRIRTKATNLTSLTSLRAEIENADELLESIKTDETCSDITFIKGNKDTYYYSTMYMSDNYAMIASLVEEKDLAKTIVEMVRFNCKTYPAPTPFSYFERSPYFATKPQIERALALISMNEEYKDIIKFDNNMNQCYIYSSEHMSDKYAKALAYVDPYSE